MEVTKWLKPSVDPTATAPHPDSTKSRRRRGTIRYLPSRAFWVRAPGSGLPTSSRPIELSYADAPFEQSGAVAAHRPAAAMPGIGF